MDKMIKISCTYPYVLIKPKGNVCCKYDIMMKFFSLNYGLLDYNFNKNQKRYYKLNKYMHFPIFSLVSRVIQNRIS